MSHYFLCLCHAYLLICTNCVSSAGEIVIVIEPLQSVTSPAVGSVSREGQGWGGWVWDWIASWFYGPDVSLLDCLAYFFSADELKGDNMYSCEKCKKLRNGLKYSQVC